MNLCELTLAVSHPHRSRTGIAGWGTWRMLWRVRERSRSSSPSQLWVAGSLSLYDVIIYLFCIELLLYSKDVTFVSVPLFIICVRLGSSTPSDYVRARLLVPRNPGVRDSSWKIRGVLKHAYASLKVTRGRVSTEREEDLEILVWML
jgi:hypothetical protein